MPRRPAQPPSSPGDRLHGDVPPERASAWDAVYACARTIPRGRVMTYGQISGLLGNRLSPRAVGWALHGCPKDVPWQRVVNAQGGCSTDRLPDHPPGLQRHLLEQEGIEFRANGTLDLERYRHEPGADRDAAPADGRPRRRGARSRP